MTLDNSNLLIFNVGPVPCCVSSDTVQVVIEPPEHISAIPGSNAFRPGLFSYRGKAVAVYDVRTKFNLPVYQRGKLLITTLNNRLSGFWIDNIEQITTADQGRWQPLPVDCPKELFDAVLLIKEQLVFKTTFEALAKAQVNTRVRAFIQTLIDKSDEKSALNNKPTKTSSSISKDTAKPAIAQPKQAEKPAETQPVQNKPVLTEKPKPITSDNALLNKPTTKEQTPATKPTTRTPTFSAQPIKPNTASDPIKRPSVTPSAPADNKTKPAVINKQIPSYQAPSSSKAKITTPVKDNTDTSVIKTPASDPVVTSKHHEENQQSTGNFAALSFFILALIIPAAGYYFYTLSDESSSNTKRTYKTKINSNTIDAPVVNPTPSTTTHSPQLVVADKKATTEEIEPVEINPVVEITPIEPTYDTNAEVDETNQQASIEQHQNEIVITINDSEARFNTTTDEIKEESTQKAEIETTESKEEKLTAVIDVVIEKQINNKEPVKTSKRVIHIVVKGDTLWHIAKRYIHDPFKYKQLARLSRIKNPDLIYPGNRIIIIIKNGKH